MNFYEKKAWERSGAAQLCGLGGPAPHLTLPRLLPPKPGRLHMRSLQPHVMLILEVVLASPVPLPHYDFEGIAFVYLKVTLSTLTSLLTAKPDKVEI